MSFRDCPECGALYQYIGKAICPSCVRSSEKDFEVVRQYVSDNPGSSINTVSEATGVSSHKILYFLKDERLSIVENDQEGWATCSRCSTPVFSVTLCNSCSAEIAKEIQRSQSPQTMIDNIVHRQTSTQKMYTMGMRR